MRQKYAWLNPLNPQLQQKHSADLGCGAILRPCRVPWRDLPTCFGDFQVVRTCRMFCQGRICANRQCGQGLRHPCSACRTAVGQKARLFSNHCFAVNEKTTSRICPRSLQGSASSRELSLHCLKQYLAIAIGYDKTDPNPLGAMRLTASVMKPV